MNKPSSLVILLMWLQMANLFVGMVFIVVVSLVIMIQGTQSVVVPLLAVAAVVAYGVLGVFTARSILRGHHWAWWLELLYTIPLVSVAIKTISQFNGFVTPTDPESFMDNVGVAIKLAMVPFFIVTPFICLLMGSQWRKREMANKASTEGEPSEFAI